MSMIQKEIGPFQVQAYHKGAFVPVCKADVLGQWSVFFFYPADFTFVCPTELEDLANLYPQFQAIGCEIYAVPGLRRLHRSRRGGRTGHLRGEPRGEDCGL